MEEKNQGLNISVRSFATALLVIFVLMIGTYILTFLVPGGELPFWKWALSPVLVLGAEGSGTIIAVLIFLLVVGGIFNSLGCSGLIQYMLDTIVHRFGASKYRLLAMISLFFMLMGALIGSFEECVPMVPIVVAVTIGLGFDALLGLFVSLLAAGCGFASGVCNPFTVGVAQELAGLPMFSGVWLRVVAFALIYGLLMLFTMRYAKKVDQDSMAERESTFVYDEKKGIALKVFGGIFGAGLVLVISSGVITALQDDTMIIVSITFLVAGLLAVKLTGMSLKEMGKTFMQGVTSVLPAVLMILMASSIKYILVEGNVLDTMLTWAVSTAKTLPIWAVILFVYLIVLVLNFFIASGSAKAFLLMPLIVPMAEVFGISAQLCVLAFAFGDGFSNAFYPTNPVLLISLGLADVSYGAWVKHTWKFQFVNLILTSAVLLFGLAVGY